jgi:hypothetical protein
MDFPNLFRLLFLSPAASESQPPPDEVSDVEWEGFLRWI